MALVITCRICFKFENRAGRAIEGNSEAELRPLSMRKLVPKVQGASRPFGQIFDKALKR